MKTVPNVSKPSPLLFAAIKTRLFFIACCVCKLLLNLITDNRSRPVQFDQFVCAQMTDYSKLSKITLIKRIDQTDCVNAQSSIGIINAD